ncbi:hypothetical protein LCGC14_2858050 [marine sediment metagenome]|uniref:Uncharacterized protein n=1 Tax=marine sediment metagenome TaxID=412755 RepID=A0A0F9AXF4_9ZZZZ
MVPEERKLKMKLLVFLLVVITMAIVYVGVTQASGPHDCGNQYVYDCPACGCNGERHVKRGLYLHAYCTCIYVWEYSEPWFCTGNWNNTCSAYCA